MIQMPRPSTPVADGKTEPMSRSWLQWLREFVASHEANKFPVGAVVMFSLSAAQLLNQDEFVQTGTTSGLGMSRFAGWAIANGNNGTPNLAGQFPRLSVAGSAPGGVSVTTGVGSSVYDLVPLMRIS